MPTSLAKAHQPDRQGAPAPAPVPASRRIDAWLAVSAGWAVATAVLAPDVLRAGAGEGGVPLVLLIAVLLWWIAVVVVIRSDLRDFIIPDEASLAIGGLGLVVVAAVPWLSGESLTEAALAVAVAVSTGAAAFAIFALVRLLFRRLGRDALGFGDVKLAGACALWLTPADAALALEIAALGAIAVLVATRRAGRLRDTAVPFGAFMAPAAWLVVVLGPLLRGPAGLLPW